MPGDVITVHAGVYREQITPPRGGESDSKRITYQSANGEKVEIKGSEVIKNWIKVNDQAWKVVIPNSFFGKFNPFNDYITGDWYENIKGRKLHTGAAYLNGHWLSEASSAEEVLYSSDYKDCWYANVNEVETIIFANFGNKNPNKELVEINVRQTIFYPQKTGINYITVKGFSMTQAATPWAPPTAEQKAIIGTNWSKRWIIENNDISYSICSGIALGKYGDKYDNTSANSAEGYVNTVERALQNGWNKETIGHHIVRKNVVSHCEQAGIVGSLGCAFSTVSNNVVHDIHVMNWYFGYEMAGIKFHGAVDVVINKNHIYNCNRGIWLDWMAQGTLVTNNLLHNNDSDKGFDQADIYLEVNHGPVVVANNFFLSERSILNRSNGTAFVHNLIAGSIMLVPEKFRETPFLKANSTFISGLATVQLGDDRWLNNIVSDKTSFDVYEDNSLPVMFTGNVLIDGAVVSRQDKLSLTNFSNLGLKITEESKGLYLEIDVDKNWAKHANTKYVTTGLLGQAALSQQKFENPDGSPFSDSTDYCGNKRSRKQPFPGPIEFRKSGRQKIKVW
jgi:alpha-N-arabinofuranosidase